MAAGRGTGPIEVRCHDYSRRMRDVEAARNWVLGVVAMGNCPNEHTITDTRDGTVITQQELLAEQA